jgi:phage/plasmid primase-like uncharacterized protein
MNAIEAASGRWPDLLAHFCGLTPDQLSDKHQPCPLCGGKDRYRFDDKMAPALGTATNAAVRTRPVVAAQAWIYSCVTNA